MTAVSRSIPRFPTPTMSKTLSNGVAIPWIGFGTGTALYNQDAELPVTSAVQSGFKHIDTAQAYVNEDSVGRAISQLPRESIFVTTKLTSLNNGETVRNSLKASLGRLGLSYVDLWLIHSPKQHVGKLKEVWKACEEVYNEGLAKSIGVSNCAIQHLEEILEVATVIPQVNQIRLNPFVYKSVKPLLEFHKEHGIVTAAYSGLSPISKGPHTLDSVLRTVQTSLEKRHAGPISEGQVLIKWLQAKDAVVVTTTSKESRMMEYLDAMNIPPLTAEEVQAIDDEGSKIH